MTKKYILILLVAIFIVSSVFIAIEASASGAEMRQLEKEESVLLMQKGEFEEILVKGISATEIEAKGVELGFAKPQDLVYLGGNEDKDQALINTLSR